MEEQKTIKELEKEKEFKNEISLKGFKCPNCNEKMEFEKQIIFDKATYDKWTCRDCSHILVLDWRNE